MTLLLALFLPFVLARAADEAAIKAEIEAVRKAGLAQWKDRLPDNFETYVRDTGTRNYYQRQFNTALTNGNATALAVVLKEFPEFARPHFLNGLVMQGKAPLMYAVEHGHAAIVELLLGRNALVDAPRLLPSAPLESGRIGFGVFPQRPGFAVPMDTPLHAAVRANRSDLARMLLNAGANLEAQDTRGETPLYISVRLLAGTPGYLAGILPPGSESREKQEQILDLLLQTGAYLTTTNRTFSPFSPLSTLVLSRNGELLDRLLTNCVQLAATNAGGETLVHIAVSNGRTNALRALLNKHPFLGARSHGGFTPLQTAAWMPPVVQLPTITSSFNPPPISLATHAAHLRQRSADLLLAAGAEPEAFSLAGLNRTNELAALLRRNPAAASARDPFERTPLHYAVNAGSTAALQLLLAAQAETEARDRSGQSPLLQALSQRRFIESANLLAAGARVAATNATGQTALHVAVVNGADTNLLAALVAAGADVNARDPAGRTPVQLAAASQRFDLVGWLEARGAATVPPALRLMTTPLHQAVAQGNIAQVTSLLTNGADVNARNEQGHTPLALAVGANRADLALLFLTNGANVNIPDTNGITPLRARFFAAHDPVPDPVPKPGFSKRPPTSAASKATATRTEALPPELRPGTQPGLPPVNNLLLLLLENGADPSLPDAKGHTILHALQPPGPDYDRSARPTTAIIPEAVARVRLLANYGLSPDTRATNGLAPLHIMAAHAGLVRTFALLEAGAGVNLADAQGRTALHHVLTPQMPFPGWHHHQVLRDSLSRTLALLLSNGADLRRADTNGNTPLHLLPTMDPALRDLVLPVLQTNGHFRAALRMKNKTGASPMLAAFDQLIAQPAAPVARLIGSFLDAGAELPAPDEGREGTLLHKLAALGVPSGPAGVLAAPAFVQAQFAMAGLVQPDAETGALLARVATNLLTRTTKVDARDAQQQTPLHIAAWAQNTTFAAALLARGANPNAQDAAGDTPLHMALRGADRPGLPLPVVPLLVSNRCDLGRLNAAGESPLRVELTRRFSRPPIFLPPAATQDFFAAARSGDVTSLDAYLRLDASLATMSDPVVKVSALRWAALAGQVKVAERLRNAGATDALSAALLGWTNSLAALVHSQPELGATLAAPGTPLLLSAASRGQLAAAQVLLTSEVSPNVADLWGRTALYHAATNGSTNLLAWLGARGARHTVFDAIALGDRPRLEALLDENPARAKATNGLAFSPLLAAVERSEQELVRRLLAAGADPNQIASTPVAVPGGFTPGTVPLHLAAWSNRVEIADLLGRARARAGVANSQGLTALHFAAAHGHVETVGWLLEHGADPNAPATGSNIVGQVPLPPHLRSLGWTPLHMAVRHGHPKIVELLVAKGAKTEATDAHGRTPADLLQRGFGMETSPWPPSPYRGLASGMPIVDVFRDPARAGEVTETLRKLGAVIPTTRGATFINRGPSPGFPVPPNIPSVPPGVTSPPKR